MDSTNSKNGLPKGMALLGGTRVNRIGFGAMQLPGPGVWGPPRDRDAALAVLRQAVQLGVNHIDTAQFYGPNISNELIHDALHPYKDNIVLVSKVGAERDAHGGWIPAQHPARLREGVEANLRTLEVEQIGVVNLRVMDTHRDGTPIPEDQRADLDDQLAEMIKLRDEGKIGDIGLSNVTLAQLERALPAGIACVQNAYSILNRAAEPLLHVCQINDIAWVPFFPLGSAFPGMPKVAENSVVIEMASRSDATPAQIGLAWLLAHAPNILLIPGTSSLDHLAENVAAAHVELDDSSMAVLDRLTD
jgi:aryl-alcohol dehydrogenase-like predicted oxidoreductase